MAYARTARDQGSADELRQWIGRIRVLRTAAARWRRKAQTIAPVIICLVGCLVGCERAMQGLSCDFSVQPAPDGRGVLWTLKFSRSEYHALLDSVPDNADINVKVHSKVHELIAAGLKINGLSACPAENPKVAKLADGSFVFLGTCDVAANVLATNGI